MLRLSEARADVSYSPLSTSAKKEGAHIKGSCLDSCYVSTQSILMLNESMLCCIYMLCNTPFLNAGTKAGKLEAAYNSI